MATLVIRFGWRSCTDLSTASFFDLTQVPRDQLRICIAEDNPINQKVAVSFVKKLGYKCEAYSDGVYRLLRH